MSESRKKIVLIDVMPLLYRGHFAFANRPRMTSDGVNTSAIYIFTLLVLQMLKEEGATHAALAMDAGPTFRHERFPLYKAQRDKMPEGISASIPMAQEFAAVMNLPFLSVKGYEADDVIGTLAKQGEAAGMEVCLFTPDKDFAQLVSERITLCRPGKADSGSERYDVARVCAEWGLSSPRQMIDLLGLAGDASDNIPGVEGVGEKTAQKLIAEYGSVEGVIAHAADLKGKLGERVALYTEEARLSRWLAEIATDAPVGVSLEELCIASPNYEALATFFKKYEMNSLAKRFLGERQEQSIAVDSSRQPSIAIDSHRLQSSTIDSRRTQSDELPLFAALGIAVEAKEKPKSAPSRQASSSSDGWQEDFLIDAPHYQHLSDIPHDYILCDTPEKLGALIRELDAATAFAFDTETTGLETWKDKMVGISFCIAPGTAWYVPLLGEGADSIQPSAQQRLDAVAPVFAKPGVLKIGHNLKFDLGVLRAAGVRVEGPFADSMLAHYVLDPTERHGMDALAKSLLRYEPIPIEQLIGGKGETQRAMDGVPVAQVAEYCAEDADVTLRLYEALMPKVKEAGAEAVLVRCENALVPVLLDMEWEGVRIDPEALRLYGAELGAEIVEVEAKIHGLAGVPFNIASPKQLGFILFERLGLPIIGKTATGQYETSEGVLAELQGKHPIIDEILEYRACTKLKSTYVDKLPQCIRESTGRVHTSFNQALTETGRLSSDNPNLQNIPIRTERGRRIREAFVARDGHHVLMSADYSQIELRLVAVLAGDKSMLSDFRRNADIHKETAARVFGVAPELVTKEMRAEAKMVNFGIIYGISAFGLAQRLGIPRKRGGELIENYFKMYPAIKEYMDRTVVEAREKGHVASLMGRRRPLRDINSRNGTQRAAAERVAINTPVQATAADLVKLAMVGIYNELRDQGLKAKLVLQVHDELVLDVPKDEVGIVSEIVKRQMTQALPLDVPLDVEVGMGENWLAAHG